MRQDIADIFESLAHSFLTIRDFLEHLNGIERLEGQLWENHTTALFIEELESHIELISQMVDDYMEAKNTGQPGIPWLS